MHLKESQIITEKQDLIMNIDFVRLVDLCQI